MRRVDRAATSGARPCLYWLKKSLAKCGWSQCTRVRSALKSFGLGVLHSFPALDLMKQTMGEELDQALFRQFVILIGKPSEPEE